VPKPVFIKKGQEEFQRLKDGKLFRMLLKSNRMEAVIAEIDPGTISEFYRHEGEEVHIVLEGKIVYEVGDKKFEMEPGDVLWHPSDVPHRAVNTGTTKAVYLTVGTPPTFM